MHGGHCGRCGRAAEDTVPLSTHPTSDGWVRYRRCGCGSVSVELLTLETCTAGTVAGPALRASEVHAGRV